MDKLLKFETNINCNGCKSKLSPFLDKAEGICHWEVDLEDEKRTLTVHSTGISPEEVTEILNRAGYRGVESRE